MPRRRTGLAALVGLTILATVPSARGEDGAKAPAVTGRLVSLGQVPVLELWGAPRERGFAQGWLLARDIVEGTDKSLDGFLGDHKNVYEMQLLPAAKAAFRFSDAEKEEMEGILAGVEARLPAEADRTIGWLGRPLRIGDIYALNTFGDLYALGCSSIALWGPHTKDGKAAVVRNFDFPALDMIVTRQHVRVVAPRDGAHGWVGISHPASIGALTAMNDAGVFTAIHDVNVLPTFKDLAQGNVPRLVAVRRLMEQLDAPGAVEKAVELCRSWNTVYGNNLMVATPEPGNGQPAGVLEYDTREDVDQGADLRCADRVDGAELTYVACTNHYRKRAHGSGWRYDTLMEGAKSSGDHPLDVADLFGLGARAALPDADSTVTKNGLATLHEVVALTGEKTLYVRFARIGGNIRNVKEERLDVPALLARLSTATPAEEPASEGQPVPADPPGSATR